MTRRAVVTVGALVAVALVVLLLVVTLGSEGQSHREDRAAYAACIKMRPGGRQLFDGRGHHPPGVGRLGQALQAIANAHQDQVSGVAMCSHYSGAMIAVAHPSDALLDEIKVQGGHYPQAQLVIHYVPNGLTAQLAAEERIGRVMVSDGLVSVGPNIYTGGLSISVLRSRWPVSGQLRRTIQSLATPNMPLDFSIGDGIGRLL